MYRYGRPRFAPLVFAGMLFGLYEAYITKMLWRPAGEAWITVADIAIVEVGVLFWWHTWFSFITPVVLAEGLLTTSREVQAGLPPFLQRFYGSRKGWLALALFGGVFQAIASPGPLRSLLSGLSAVGVLVALTLLWRRTTAGRAYALAELLPGPRALRWMLLGLAGIYLLHIIAVTPERIPPFWPGQAIIWALYALVLALFLRALRRSRRPVPTAHAPRPPFPRAQALLGAGVLFVLVLPLAKAVLRDAVAPVLVVGWLGGSAFEIWAVGRALQETLRA